MVLYMLEKIMCNGVIIFFLLICNRPFIFFPYMMVGPYYKVKGGREKNRNKENIFFRCLKSHHVTFSYLKIFNFDLI